jgi:hypothetical protein
MVNLKNITDVPMAESAEGLNLIVNDNGAAKQIAASAVGAQADWNETDETSPAFIMNKPDMISGGNGCVVYTTTRGLFYYGNWETDGTQVSYSDFMNDFSNGVVRLSGGSNSCGTIVAYNINGANALRVNIIDNFGSGNGNDAALRTMITNYTVV